MSLDIKALLEQMDDWLSAINCSSGSITLYKHTDLDFAMFDDLHELAGGHVITSHSGCNAEHERLPYRSVGICTSRDTFTDQAQGRRGRNLFHRCRCTVGHSNQEG